MLWKFQKKKPEAIFFTLRPVDALNKMIKCFIFIRNKRFGDLSVKKPEFEISENELLVCSSHFFSIRIDCVSYDKWEQTTWYIYIDDCEVVLHLANADDRYYSTLSIAQFAIDKSKRIHKTETIPKFVCSHFSRTHTRTRTLINTPGLLVTVAGYHIHLISAPSDKRGVKVEQPIRNKSFNQIDEQQKETKTNVQTNKNDGETEKKRR